MELNDRFRFVLTKFWNTCMSFSFMSNILKVLHISRFVPNVLEAWHIHKSSNFGFSFLPVISRVCWVERIFHEYYEQYSHLHTGDLSVALPPELACFFTLYYHNVTDARVNEKEGWQAHRCLNSRTKNVECLTPENSRDTNFFFFWWIYTAALNMMIG